MRRMTASLAALVLFASLSIAAQTGGGITPSTADGTYLRLDCSNDPLTGELSLGGNNLTTAGTFEGARIVLGDTGSTLNIHGATFMANLKSDSQSLLDLTSVWVSHSDTVYVAPIMYFARSRGLHTLETIVQDGDSLGSIFFSGYDGTDYNQSALIASEVDGTPGANAVPGALVFKTSPAGTNETVTRVRIAADGTTVFSSAVDIGSGAIDGTVIGASAPAAGAFTTLTATNASITGTATIAAARITTLTATNAAITGTSTIAALVAATADINAGTIDGTTIGGSVPAAGTFTTLGASGNVSIEGTTTLATLEATNGINAGGASILKTYDFIHTVTTGEDTINLASLEVISENIAMADIRAIAGGFYDGSADDYIQSTDSSSSLICKPQITGNDAGVAATINWYFSTACVQGDKVTCIIWVKQ